MIRSTGRVRRGFTLIELLVVIGLIAALAGITMLIAPSAMERDRAATAATQLTSAMQISRARAARDGLPRGIRLIYNGSAQVTEYQYIEAPQAYVPNPNGYGPHATVLSPPPPFVRLDYATDATGQITNRVCTILNLTPDQQAQIAGSVGGTLYLPTLGTWHQITSVSGAGTLTLTLDQFPDGPMGGQTAWRTYHFGVYSPARPILGEPTYQLPQKTCVDFALSSPAGGATDYDILFAPSGQLAATPATAGAGHVFLWIRDPNRGSLPAPDFRGGGEMILVVVKARSGAVGTAPVDQTSPANWYDFGRKAVSGQ